MSFAFSTSGKLLQLTFMYNACQESIARQHEIINIHQAPDKIDT